MLTELEQAAYESLASALCPGCAGAKKPRQSFCRSCFFKLPKPLRQSLYGAVGYADNFSKAIAFLKALLRA